MRVQCWELAQTPLAQDSEMRPRTTVRAWATSRCVGNNMQAPLATGSMHRIDLGPVCMLFRLPAGKYCEQPPLLRTEDSICESCIIQLESQLDASSEELALF